MRYSSYMKSLFPNSKYILMIRDGRATVHSIITRKVTITGFDLTSYRDCLARWNNIIESMYAQCIAGNYSWLFDFDIETTTLAIVSMTIYEWFQIFINANILS